MYFGWPFNFIQSRVHSQKIIEKDGDGLKGLILRRCSTLNSTHASKLRECSCSCTAVGTSTAAPQFMPGRRNMSAFIRSQKDVHLRLKKIISLSC